MDTNNPISYPAQMYTQAFGKLQVTTTTEFGDRPIPDAKIQVFSENTSTVLEELVTDGSGQTQEIDLPAPPVDYSLEPTTEQPYSLYTLRISAPGFRPIEINGLEMLPLVTSIQPAELMKSEDTSQEEVFNIPPHTLYGEYPPKIPEEEVKPIEESGEIVLSRVVIPEFIIVHDGLPTNTSAKNHYVKYLDYIKNVASSEIYATWPSATIYANILAIMSFTLNRVYTEWYRNKGYNFTITSSTAFDHKWIPGRNIFSTISSAVDDVFNNYLSRPRVIQPILTQYCDGQRVQCPGWMSQWGSKSLGDKGFKAIDILRRYYGSSMYINSTTQVSGVPSSWPGSNLRTGSSGESVREIQRQLNSISNVYTAIPKLAVDGKYGPMTTNSVKTFQRIFRLPVTGVVDLPTWYKISGIYVGINRLAEL